MAPVWLMAALAPAALRPTLSRMMGFTLDTARAALMNLR